MSAPESFLLGVAASLAATVLWGYIKAWLSNKPIPCLDGYWFEVIPRSPDRRYSIGKFAFNRSDGSYSFDGVNYKNGGEIFCKWKSSMVEIDRANREIIYVFKAYIREESYMQNHGFGVVRTEANDNGNPVPVAGHYIETREDASPYTHSMIPLEKIIEELGISREEEDTEHFHSRIVRSYHEKNRDEQQEALA